MILVPTISLGCCTFFAPVWLPISLFVRYELRTSLDPDSVKLQISYLESSELTRGTAFVRVIRHGERAVYDLVTTLEDENTSPTLRARCADCLGRIGVKSDKAIKALRKNVNNKESDQLRFRSLKALWELEGDSAAVIAGLRELANSDDTNVRAEVVDVLSDIASKSR